MRYLMLAAAGLIAACTASTPAFAQTKPLTLSNLKGPIAKASGKAPAKSVKDLWGQIEGLPVAAPSPAPTPEPANYWIDCAQEGGTCTLPIKRATQVRYGALGKYVYREVTNAISCGNAGFGGDPLPNVVKACAYANSTSTAPVITINKPDAARDRLGVNVAPVSYYGNEPVYANQALAQTWLSSWQALPPERLRSDGMPLSVDPVSPVTLILVPPAPAFVKGDSTTRCTWNGTGSIMASGYSTAVGNGPQEIVFKWKDIDRPFVWLEMKSSNAADPVRDLDCRLISDPADALFTSQLIDYLKPFGVLRFLDWSSANGNPATVSWATRGKPGGLNINGPDGAALENEIALANAVGSSPWFTVAWNADADYHRRMAQLVHDSVPAGKAVYIEVSNEVWNYQFGQTGQAQKEGLDAKLSDNGFQAVLFRYAQKITEVMPIWAEVFKDRPKDLVRVAATQGSNAWVGQQILEWNNSAVIPHIDAVAIAPYFQVDPVTLTGDQASNMALLAAEAKKQIEVSSAAYQTMVSRYGKRLIAYEGGQHQIDPGNQARLEAINRDPAMEGIYRQYLTGWNALTSDLFTLYSATGPISQYGAWGLREYAGQPISETPKLRGVIDQK